MMEEKKKRELKGPSLTVKWAFASSFFIFVVFTIFAVITYKSSVNLIVAKEEKNVTDTMREVVSRLDNAKSELNHATAFTYITTLEDGVDLFNGGSAILEGNVLKIDQFIGQIGQDSLGLFIYNLNGDLVFQTDTDNMQLEEKERKEPAIINLDGQTGYLAIEPVYSEVNGEKIGYAQIFYELSSFYEIRSRLLLTLIVLEVISLVLSSVLGSLLSAYFLKPLKVLRDTMNIIRKDPQSNVHMPEINTNDELTDLAEIFNDMIDRMRLYMEQQERFVEDVSHELRTPVAIIEGHLSLLNRWGKDDPEILDESLQASMQEISRMKSLVQEMLDLSRAEQSDIQYVNETSRIKEVIHQVYNNFKLLYPEYNLVLDDQLTEEKTLGIYRNHLEQLVIIILDNAVKYSTERKEVHIAVREDAEDVEISIQDFGEGIPEEDLDKIFNRFYRVDKARARTKGGNGLGLSIAKQLAENYKGRISATSVVGEGTTFKIYIPIIKEK